MTENQQDLVTRLEALEARVKELEVAWGRRPAELQRADRLPDMNDMFVAGLPLNTAVNVMDQMAASPDLPPSHWWNLVKLLTSEAELGPPT